MKHLLLSGHQFDRTDSNNIKVDLPGEKDCMVFYKDLALITVEVFPLCSVYVIITVFLLIAYLLFSTSRRSETVLGGDGTKRLTSWQFHVSGGVTEIKRN